MAKTKRKSLQQHIEEQVINKLMVDPHSVGMLATITGENYYTVRKAVKRLEETGLVKTKGHKGNIVMYTLTEPSADHPNNSIPVGKSNNGPLKLTLLLDSVGKENKSLASAAASALPRNMARILMAALRNVESNGTYDTKTNVRNIRTELENNLKVLEQVVGLYKTLLQADVFWDENKIKAIPYDATFDRDKVIEAYRHYYPED